jgi:hypothetical protein
MDADVAEVAEEYHRAGASTIVKELTSAAKAGSFLVP